MKRLLIRGLRYLAVQHKLAVSWYRRFGQPDGEQWAEYVRRHGGLQRMGQHCSIQTNVTITDPAYVALGSNVRLSGCTLFGHDGSVNMLNRAYGLNLDRVGKIVLHDHVFIGHQAIVLPGVSIGPYALVAAGAVVNRDVPPNSIVAGVPARVVGRLDAYAQQLAQQTAHLPWFALLQQRGPMFDPQLQPQLDALRVAHFFPSAESAESETPESG